MCAASHLAACQSALACASDGVAASHTCSWSLVRTGSTPQLSTRVTPYLAISLHAGNAFAIFPASPAKVVGIVLMVAHQLVAYGLFILPVCIMWEKLVKTHHKSLLWRLPSRLPVGEYSRRLETGLIAVLCVFGSRCRCSRHQPGWRPTTCCVLTALGS